jgi:prevent-host-death family protein
MGLVLPVDYFCTVIAKWRFEAMQRKGAEEARNKLPDLLTAAEKGRATIITRHGRPVAALVPIGAYGAAVRRPPPKGSGRGL